MIMTLLNIVTFIFQIIYSSTDNYHAFEDCYYEDYWDYYDCDQLPWAIASFAIISTINVPLGVWTIIVPVHGWKEQEHYDRSKALVKSLG